MKLDLIGYFFLFSLQSLLLFKQLISDSFRDSLHEANEKECALLEDQDFIELNHDELQRLKF